MRLGSTEDPSCIRPLWFVMLCSIVLVVLRCNRLVNIAVNCFTLFQDFLGSFRLFYVDSNCFSFVFGCSILFLFRCMLFKLKPSFRLLQVFKLGLSL